MASVNTNAAAITALRTLQQTNAQLDMTQNRISTGLRIGEAKDNAAYWAISTTLKSDNKSLGTVKDALGLGAATVDVAYQGLNKAKDVLDEIKAKLTAATQPGVDRNVIQSEIAELQKQLVSIAASSTISGENWLSVNSEATDYTAVKKIVASFARDASNSVSIGTVDVAIGDLALFDSSTVVGKNGILDGLQGLKAADGRDLDLGTANAVGNTSAAGVTATAAAGVSGTATGAGVAVAATTLGSAAVNGSASTAVYGGGTGLAITGGVAANDTIVVTFAGGHTRTVTLTANQAEVTWAQIAAGVAGGTAATFGLAATANDFTVTNNVNGTAAAPTITGVAFGTNTNGASIAAAPTPTSTAGIADTPASEAVVKSGALTASQFAVGDVVTVKLNVDGTSTDYSTAALTGATLADIAAALDTAMNGVADVAVGTGGDAGRLIFTAAATGAKTTFSLEALTAVDANGEGKTITNGIGTLATRASTEGAAFAAVTLDDDDNIYMKIGVDGGAVKNVTIDKALVDATLGVTTGAIASAAEDKQVLDAALTKAGVAGVTTSVTNTNRITFSSNTVGASSKVVISDVAASAGADEMSIDMIDISATGLAAAGATSGDQIASVLSAYITIVNNAINQVTTAAANLGAVASRIDMQKSFVNSLMDTIDKGVGNLIDADMSEESTKLQALQVKQQLGVQALSIANQSSQNILRLFQ